MNAPALHSHNAKSKAISADVLHRSHLDKIRLVVGESRDQTRSALCNILKLIGFTRITAYNNIDQVCARIADNLADLVICDADIEGGDIRSVVRDVRRQKIGTNPFIFMVCIAHSGGADLVRTCIDSGIDDLTLAPISAASISARISALANSRKPFVVTRDYIGPDRRRSERPEGEEIPKLEAPNIFDYVKNGSRGKGFYQDIVKKGSAVLKDRWAERQAIQVAYLVEKCLPILAQRPSRTDDITQTFVDDFTTTAKAAEHAIIGTRYASEDIVLNTLSTVLTRACAAETPMAEDLATLEKLVRIVRKTFAAQIAA